MTLSHWMRGHSSVARDMTTDVLIVGAGYAGLSLAYWITEMDPGLKITIVDRAHAGAGASGRNAGFLTKGSAAFFKSLALKWGEDKALEIFHFASESIELVHKHILKHSNEINFKETSSLTLIQSDHQFSEWKNYPQIQDKFEFRWKNHDELPAILQKNFQGGFESAHEFKVNPIQLLTTIRKILESRKVSIVEHTSVFEILPDGVLTETGRIKARKTILALNGYSAQFSKAFADIIAPKRAQMLAVEVSSEVVAPYLIYDPADKVYWRKEGEKVIVIGGKRLMDEEAENGDFEKLSPVIQAGLESYLKDKLKINYKVLNRWSGIMGFTEHELPFLQKINSPADTYMLGGFSGHGMGFGFKAGLEMAEIITGKKKNSFFQQFRNADINL